MASTVYRLSVLQNVHTYIPNADRARSSLFDGSHIDSDGWLNPVVNPLSFAASGSKSPESEAFVLMLHAAWKDWVAAGSKGGTGKNAATSGKFEMVPARAMVAGLSAVVFGALVVL